MNKKYIHSIILLGLIVSIGFTSCKVGKSYKTPEVDVENLFRDQTATDTTTIANIPWREYFTDPMLQALVDEGISNNFDLQIATTRIRQAEASLSIAKAAYLPNIALVGQVQDARTSIDKGVENVLGYNKTQYSLGISASWEADIWGKMSSQSKARHAQFLASHTYRNLVQTSLVSTIATSYYSLLALDEQLRITKETVELLKESTSTIQDLMTAGMLTGAAIQQSQALLYGTQVSIPNLEMQIRQLENTICVTLGRKPGTLTRSSIQKQAVPTNLSYGIPMQMLAKRPDVLQAELGFRAAFELTNVAKASFYPSITLNSGSMIGFGGSSLSNFFKPEHLIANVIGGLTQPIFAKKQIKGQLKIAQAQQEEASLTFQKTVLNASKEVSDILFTYESSLKKNELRSQQVNSLKTAVYFTQELLKEGEANYTEVLNAEQSLLNAQLGQVSDKLEQLQASVSLYRALGGGVE